MDKKRKYGRQLGQKMKPYLVYRYLMKETDENHTLTNKEISDHIQTMGISAERKSIDLHHMMTQNKKRAFNKPSTFLVYHKNIHL